MEARITNITLEKDKFKVFVEFSNGKHESNLFIDRVSEKDITNWITERLEFFVGLDTKVKKLKQDMIDLEITVEDLI